MKEKIYIFFTATLLFTFFAACNDEGGKTDSRITPVTTFFEPADGKSIVLKTAASAELYFEWEYCDPSQTGLVSYMLAFDKPEGDFSNPVYLMSSGNNGLQNYASLTHKQMNNIARMMGIGNGETGSFKWTVFSTKGLKTAYAQEVRTITITRLAGYDDLPVDICLTGKGSEGGDDSSNMSKMKATAPGEFEIYTRLEAGKPFCFVETGEADNRTFFTEDGLIKENGNSMVSTTGVYRIILDFTTGAYSYTLVTRIGFFFSPTNTILFDLPYIGKGIFQAKDQTVTFHQETWGRDERYKFRMFVKENAGTASEREMEWCTLNATDARPTPSSPESYYYVRLSETVTQWDNKWKLMSDFDGVPANYTLYLYADGPYTHFISK